MAHRWGEPPQPAQPAALHASALVAALIAQALDGTLGLATRLAWVETSVSLNLVTLASQRDAVHRLPACPVCAPEASPDGRLPLPWAAAHPIEELP